MHLLRAILGYFATTQLRVHVSSVPFLDPWLTKLLLAQYTKPGIRSSVPRLIALIEKKELFTISE